MAEQSPSHSSRSQISGSMTRPSHWEDSGEAVSVPQMFYVATVLGEQPWLAGQDILVSAGTAWKDPGQHGVGEGFDINVPEHDRLFVDSGGFQATVHFGGEYPYDDAELFVWAEDLGADFVAGMDFACERAAVLEAEIDAASASSIPSIDERIEKTITTQIRQYDLYREGADVEDGWSFKFVPVIQGHSVEQYRYCAERLKAAGLASEYMAIGSVCKRDGPDTILAVLDACRDVLPGTEFHLFGATRLVWKDRRFWGGFRSSDTHAWGVSHPDGGWPTNNEEKTEAFAHFDRDIRTVSEAIERQTTIEAATNGRQAQRARRLPGNRTAGVCEFCGTEIPAYGIRFLPGCTACERIKLHRWSYGLGRVEAEVDSTAEANSHRSTDSEQQHSLTERDWIRESAEKHVTVRES